MELVDVVKLLQLLLLVGVLVGEVQKHKLAHNLVDIRPQQSVVDQVGELHMVLVEDNMAEQSLEVPSMEAAQLKVALRLEGLRLLVQRVQS